MAMAAAELIIGPTILVHGGLVWVPDCSLWVGNQSCLDFLAFCRREWTRVHQHNFRHCPHLPNDCALFRDLIQSTGESAEHRVRIWLLVNDRDSTQFRTVNRHHLLRKQVSRAVITVGLHTYLVYDGEAHK